MELSTRQIDKIWTIDRFFRYSIKSSYQISIKNEQILMIDYRISINLLTNTSSPNQLKRPDFFIFFFVIPYFLILFQLQFTLLDRHVFLYPILSNCTFQNIFKNLHTKKNSHKYHKTQLVIYRIIKNIHSFLVCLFKPTNS